MSVVGTVDVSAGLYVPFRGVDRRKSPVGTVAVDGEVTGDAGGGAATINITATREMFGFHPMLAATRIHTFDSLATLEAIRLILNFAGNERISGNFSEVVSPVEQGTDNNVANAAFLGVPIEPDQVVAANILSAVWTTNEDGDLYHLHAFFVVYDLQELARRPGDGEIDLLVAGIR